MKVRVTEVKIIEVPDFMIELVEEAIELNKTNRDEGDEMLAEVVGDIENHYGVEEWESYKCEVIK